MGGQSEVRAVAAAAAAVSVDFLLLLSSPIAGGAGGGTLLVEGKEGSGRTEENCIRSHTAREKKPKVRGQKRGSLFPFRRHSYSDSNEGGGGSWGPQLEKMMLNLAKKPNPFPLCKKGFLYFSLLWGHALPPSRTFSSLVSQRNMNSKTAKKSEKKRRT